jgi:hypothetical protein
MIVCKDNTLVKEKLTIGKKYEPLGYISGSSAVYKSDRFVYVICDDGIQRNFSEARFVSLEEFRDIQLNKII